MDIKKVCKELSNDMQLELLRLLKTKKNINQLQKELKRKTNKQVYRETIYNKLENLVELGIVKKEYDSKTKRLVYYEVVKSVTLDLDKVAVTEILKKE